MQWGCTFSVVNHSIKYNIYMLKRPTERMDNISGGGVVVGVISSSAQAPVIKPSSTTLSIMKFNSIKPHVKYLNTG